LNNKKYLSHVKLPEFFKNGFINEVLAFSMVLKAKNLPKKWRFFEVGLEN
jgi:hypothetical protein